jgi:putative ABC transport system substrate-binding protein
MNRRESVLFALVALAATPFARAQQAGRIPRIALITITKREGSTTFDTVMQRMRELGYLEGQTLVSARYYAEENPERLASQAAEIVAQKPDVIVAVATPAIRAVHLLTKTIPIVMCPATDPVGSGFVASLARPGGNITGVANQTIDLSAKLVQLLRETAPRAKRIALLRTDNPTHPAQIKEVQDAAKAHGMTVFPVTARSGEEIDMAFPLMSKEKAEALIVLADPILVAQRQRIADLAIKQKLPSIYQFREHAVSGGLASYGPRLPDLYRLAATYVDKILKGVKPADLPVEQPTRFELVINRKTAESLNIKIPPDVLLRADEVIE